MARHIQKAKLFFAAFGIFAASIAFVPPGFSGELYDDKLVFHYLNEKNKHDLNGGGAILLQSRFVYRHAGEGGQLYDNEHAIVAYTQGDADAVWRHGVGAFVNQHGLNIEFWFQGSHVCEAAGAIPGPRAYLWNQTNDRKQMAVNGGCALPNPIQLSAVPDAAGYMTSAPDFVMKKGEKYWIRMKIFGNAGHPGHAVLYADLVHEKDAGAAIVQHALIGFHVDQFFPENSILKGTVARAADLTRYMEVLDYVAFDHGF